jgi:histidinol-phosphate aminotransferase
MTPAPPRPGLRDVAPYEAPQLEMKARLNTNESPYPLPDAFREDLANAVRRIDLNRYPDRDAAALRARLAELNGHRLEGTWVANGSNEILMQLLQAYAGPGRRVVVFEPTYSMHWRLAWVAGSEVVRIPLDEPWTIGPGEVSESTAPRPNVIFVCSPNNPTGNSQSFATVERLAEAGDALVVVDQAYVEFGGESAVPLVATHPNVVVVRTFSKAFALAGARLGYCLAAPEVVEDLRRVRLPYHLSAITQAAGLVALDHREEALSILGQVRAERDRILESLPKMDVRAFGSDANFVLFRPPKPAEQVWQSLLERSVLVRDFTNLVPGCLRVTAGTPEEVDLFLSALEEILAEEVPA